MIDIHKRSLQKELLDRDNISFADIMQNMKELNFINTHLGGHAITLAGLKSLSKNKKTLSICEIGCGGGDNLSAILDFGKKNNIDISAIGIDINPACIEYAKSKNSAIQFIHLDYKLVKFQEKPDIIFSSLFCHHFTDEQLTEMLQWMRDHSTIGFFINDLHRNLIAYYFIKYATKLFSRSYLVKNDAPLSVLRGFTLRDWKALLDKAGITGYKIKWKWAFRYLITVAHDGS
ncbi:hypothetical protein BH09BAC2_BH09BAC2_00600 [soil metagenome]